MSRARHKEMKERAAGGKVTAYAGGDSNVMKEAHERKRGGKVEHHKEHMHGEGEHAKHRADKRARGGRMHTAGHGHTSHHEHGEMHAKPHGRATGGSVSVPGRKRGGGIGANLTPLSTAARIKEVTKGEQKED